MIKQTFIALSFAVLALCTACDKTPQPPMVFGASPWPGYEPVYLAGEQGYFQGGNLRLDAYKDPAATEEAFRSRKAHLVALTLERALLLRKDVPELKIILLFGAGPGKRMDVLVTRDEYIGEYHREMQQFLQGWRQAQEYIRVNPEKAMQSMVRHAGVSGEEFAAMKQGFEPYGYQRNQQAMVGEPPPVASAIEAAQRDLLNQGKLSMGMDTSMLIDSTLLAESPK
jgi:ABC-type nitrate/sulfonate/bicarbonate transport system substrate-binding protein